MSFAIIPKLTFKFRVCFRVFCHGIAKGEIVRLNLINHVLALFREKFACNSALKNPVFRWESCKGSV